MPANVLHILGTAQPEGSSVVHIVAALAKGLETRRYRIHACFLAGDGSLAAELQAAGVEVRTLDWHGGARDPVGAWRFWRLLHDEDLAIVHQHWGGRAPRWLIRRLGQAKMITHFHGHFIESHGLAPVALRVTGADLVIATSRAVAGCVVGAQARVVYPGVEIRENHCGGPTTSRTLGETVLGTAGRLVPLKGIIYLIRALALVHRDMPGVRLEIAGSGPERASLEQEVGLHGLGDHVRFLGWQPDLRSVMAGWDVYVQPSLGEPFGIAALEAMAAGLPVVATAAGGLPELVEDGRTGWLVPPRDPVALADRLRALLLDAEQRCRMGAAARARAREKFSVERMVRDISNIYDEVVTRRERASR